MEEKYIQLTNKIFSLLEFFPDDPLKNKAKEKALAIMDGKDVPANVNSLLNLLKIAKEHGWMAPLNHCIIANEYKKIAKEVVAVQPVAETPAKFAPKPKKPGPKPVFADGAELTGRQKKIVDFLAKKQKAQVSDLMKVLPGVTKRTIRRDLDELLKSKNVQRKGEFNGVSYQLAG